MAVPLPVRARVTTPLPGFSQPQYESGFTPEHASQYFVISGLYLVALSHPASNFQPRLSMPDVPPLKSFNSFSLTPLAAPQTGAFDALAEANAVISALKPGAYLKDGFDLPDSMATPRTQSAHATTTAAEARRANREPTCLMPATGKVFSSAFESVGAKMADTVNSGRVSSSGVRLPAEFAAPPKLGGGIATLVIARWQLGCRMLGGGANVATRLA
mmetsp:Transcript_14234/g.39229  ORF Transcript_14234/g.39229 Transcript_14234/m.39229 type:complete len:216 (+) Transcript_14234:1654-2301(+)